MAARTPRRSYYLVTESRSPLRANPRRETLGALSVCLEGASAAKGSLLGSCRERDGERGFRAAQGGAHARAGACSRSAHAPATAGRAHDARTPRQGPAVSPGGSLLAPQKRQPDQRAVSPRLRPGNRRRRPKRALCGSASYCVALALPGFLQRCCALPGRPLLLMARPARTTTRSQLRRRRRCAAAAPPPHPPPQTLPPADLSLSLSPQRRTQALLPVTGGVQAARAAGRGEDGLWRGGGGGALQNVSRRPRRRGLAPGLVSGLSLVAQSAHLCHTFLCAQASEVVSMGVGLVGEGGQDVEGAGDGRH